jgi:hypothetical protein
MQKRNHGDSRELNMIPAVRTRIDTQRISDASSIDHTRADARTMNLRESCIVSADFYARDQEPMLTSFYPHTEYIRCLLMTEI